MTIAERRTTKIILNRIWNLVSVGAIALCITVVFVFFLNAKSIEQSIHTQVPITTFEEVDSLRQELYKANKMVIQLKHRSDTVIINRR